MLGWTLETREAAPNAAMPAGAHRLLVSLARGGAPGLALCAIVLAVGVLVAGLLLGVTLCAAEWWQPGCSSQASSSYERNLLMGTSATAR